MLCSGCGKDIPFTGEVCPHCQRDKSQDKNYSVAAFFLGVLGALIGYLIFDLWGAIAGFFVGCVVAAAMTMTGETSPPKVTVVGSLPSGELTIVEKLTQLKELHDNGLITDDEFTNRKGELLAKL